MFPQAFSETRAAEHGVGNARTSHTGFWLSPQQEFVWKLSTQPSAGQAAGRAWWRCRGGDRGGQLRDSLRELVTRHEILRTVFRRQAGLKVPFQLVLETTELGGRRKTCPGWPRLNTTRKSENFFTGSKRRPGTWKGPVLSACWSSAIRIPLPCS